MYTIGVSAKNENKSPHSDNVDYASVSIGISPIITMCELPSNMLKRQKPLWWLEKIYSTGYINRRNYEDLPTDTNRLIEHLKKSHFQKPKKLILQFFGALSLGHF